MNEFLIPSIAFILAPLITLLVGKSSESQTVSATVLVILSTIVPLILGALLNFGAAWGGSGPSVDLWLCGLTGFFGSLLVSAIILEVRLPKARKQERKEAELIARVRSFDRRNPGSQTNGSAKSL